MRETVRQVAKLFPTAIISGRGREKVEGFVQLPELFYAGSHGMDIVGPKVRHALQIACTTGQNGTAQHNSYLQVLLPAVAFAVAAGPGLPHVLGWLADLGHCRTSAHSAYAIQGMISSLGGRSAAVAVKNFIRHIETAKFLLLSEARADMSRGCSF